METRLEQQPRQRARQRGQMTVQARQEQVDEVRQWERDWRATITTQVNNIAENTTQMSLIVREMQGDVRDLMEWKQSQDKRRDEADDKRPDDRRSNLALLVSAGTAVLYALGYIAAHWRP